MQELPSTLDAFYERTLLEIDEADRDCVQVAFCWISCAFRAITLDQLAEIMSLRHDDSLSIDTVIEILPAGMISIPGFSNPAENERGLLGYLFVEFAHFSAKEFLMSNRICQSQLSQHYLDERLAHITIVETCITHFLHVSEYDLTANVFILESFPLLQYSARFWPDHILALEDYEDIPTLMELIRKFLDSSIVYSIGMISLGLRRGLGRQRRYYSQM